MANCNSVDTNSSSDDPEAQDKLQLKNTAELSDLGQKELIEYIKKLHKKLANTCRKLRTFRQKLKDVSQYGDKITPVVTEKSMMKKNSTDEANKIEEQFDEKLASVQETQDERNNKTKDDTENSFSATDAFSFVNEMRQKAEQAQNINNFVYEPTSGLYYDPKTGYYYNAEYGLYYDGNTGCYYSYDEKKQSFEFHSHAQVQNQQSTGSAAAHDDAGKDNEEDDDDIDEVEFDEYGGVITDRSMLKQIRGQKEKAKRKQLEKKHKSKNKKDKKEKNHSKPRKSKKRHKSEVKKEAKRRRKDFEDGELSTSSSSSESGRSESGSDSCSEDESDSENNNNGAAVPHFKAIGHFQDIARKYPPSLRIIVQETNVENLRVGSLYMITFKGGSLGREGTHDVIIPDVNVSKFHLKFNYDRKMGIYKCIDLGSRNGTLLNGTRMSTTKSESQPQDLVHGSIIQIAQTKLLCHVHEGNTTCGLCEPGLLIETQTRENSSSATPVTLTHKEQLKMIQKKYGLENEKFVETKTNVSGNYNDRAATRRIKVGSSTDKEKTQVACVNTEISSENKGFKMLSKLGWSKGNALGKSQASSGLLAPINVVSNEGKTGFGCEQQPTTSVACTAAAKQRLANLKITQERYKRADIFIESSDDSN